MNLIEELRLRASQAAARPAIIDAAGAELSYKELWVNVDARRSALDSTGVAAGQCVAICVENALDFVVLLLACLSNGVSVAPYDASPASLRRVLRFDSVSHLVTSDPISLHDLAGTFSSALGAWVYGLGASGTGGNYPELWLPSSGSSGSVKTARLSMDGCGFVTSANASALGISPVERSLQVLPMTYSYGLVGQLLTHMMCGATTIMAPMGPLGYLQIPELCRRFGITTLMLVPRMVRLLAASRKDAWVGHSLRLVTVGGGAIDGCNFRKLRDQVSPGVVGVTYGLVEAGPRVCTGFVDAEAVDCGAVGVPLDGVTVRSGGSRSDPSTLRIKSPGLMRGYATPAEATAIDPSGQWLDSGDLGYVERGNVYVVGRRNRRVLVDGRVLQLEDVERDLYGGGDVLAVSAEYGEDSGILAVEVVSFPGPHADLGQVSRRLSAQFGLDRERISVRRSELWAAKV